MSATPTGEATFSGDYSAFLIQCGRQVTEDDTAGNTVLGNIELRVDFADFLSQSTLSGTITDRLMVSTATGLGNRDFALANVSISNGQIDNNGQFVAETSGGVRIVISDRVSPERFDDTTETGSVSGQIGGVTADTVAGLVRIEHTVIDNLPSRPEPRVDHLTEVGGFIATAD